jgi:hypothetical protein
MGMESRTERIVSTVRSEAGGAVIVIRLIRNIHEHFWEVLSFEFWVLSYPEPTQHSELITQNSAKPLTQNPELKTQNFESRLSRYEVPD